MYRGLSPPVMTSIIGGSDTHQLTDWLSDKKACLHLLTAGFQ
jgi:hypothetical protein